MPVFEHFFRDIDAGWKWPGEGKILLKVLGSAALILQADYERGTKDGDVLETEQLDAETQDKDHSLHIHGLGGLSVLAQTGQKDAQVVQLVVQW